jgi:hypothetical protein
LKNLQGKFIICQSNIRLPFERNMKKNLLLIILLLSCRIEETAEEQNFQDLFLAISVKSNQCGNFPGYFPTPIISEKSDCAPLKKDTNNCTLAIIQSKCPFKTYPPNCILLLKKLKESCFFGDNDN